MRVVGGEYRGRKLDSPSNNDIRPTSDKVRQAVFNMLNSRGLVVDSVVIDAFCGTGALGIEALSQGASHAVFFDKSKQSYQLARDNIQSFDLHDVSTLYFKDCTAVSEKPDDIEQASLVFLDPPYHKELIPQAIGNLVEKNWIELEAMFLMEMAKDEDVICPLIDIHHEKIYGDTKVLLGQLR